MTVNLSSAGTKDFDRDALAYEWKILDQDGKVLSTMKEENSKFTFEQAGVYKAALTVTDAAGEKAGKEIEILAGNEPPEVKFEITRGNQTFFFPNQPFEYAVTVSDKEDGSLADGRIEPEEISVRIDYLAEGFDKVEIAQGHLSADAFAKFAKGKKLIDQNDCKSCHIIDRKSIGPTYLDVAAKYKDDTKATDYLVKKIIQGGTGVWGEVAMASHPQLSVADATEMVNYILNLGVEEKIVRLAPQGTYTPTATSFDGNGVYIMRAAYTDNGANGIEASTVEKTMILKSASFSASIADETDGVQRFKLPQPPMDLMIGSRSGGYMRYNKLDLSGISEVTCYVFAPEAQLNAAGGTIEVRLDRVDGTLVGESKAIVPSKGKDPSLTPTIANIKISPTTGVHDVYFIFRNEKAPGGQSLFIISNIAFKYDAKAFTNALTLK